MSGPVVTGGYRAAKVIFSTKALPPNAALAQLFIVQGKGEMTSNVLYTILLSECA